MVVDTSALVALALQEEGWEKIEAALTSTSSIKMSLASYVELRIVLMNRFGPASESLVAGLMTAAEILLVGVDEHVAMIACDAASRFGKGRHPAGLNFGDCFSYALAMQRGEPLLFKGNDFSQTDVLIAAY